MYSRNKKKDARPLAGIAKMKLAVGFPAIIATFIYSVLALTVGGTV